MKDQIVMSPINGFCCVAIPLFRKHEMNDSSLGYEIKFIIEEEKPVAYAIEYGEGIQLMNAEFVEKNLEFLGDL